MADASRLNGATEPGPPNVEATPEQFAARWNARTRAERAEWLNDRRNDSRAAMNCWVMQHEHRIEELAGRISAVLNVVTELEREAQGMDGGYVDGVLESAARIRAALEAP